MIFKTIAKCKHFMNCIYSLLFGLLYVIMSITFFLKLLEVRYAEKIRTARLSCCDNGTAYRKQMEVADPAESSRPSVEI